MRCDAEIQAQRMQEIIERAAKSLCASVEALDYAKFLEKQPTNETRDEQG